jgi:hypothetical protein
MSATLDKVIEEVKTLTPDELQQVRTAVDSLLAETPPPHMTEDEFEQYLAAKGVISLPQVSEDDDADNEDWEPVEVTGKPLSEMIIEERR